MSLMLSYLPRRSRLAPAVDVLEEAVSLAPAFLRFPRSLVPGARDVAGCVRRWLPRVALPVLALACSGWVRYTLDRMTWEGLPAVPPRLGQATPAWTGPAAWSREQALRRLGYRPVDVNRRASVVAAAAAVPARPSAAPAGRAAVAVGAAGTSADALMADLKTVFREEGVPPELVWIAAVESLLDPRARSRAGAGGLFQLMRPTARRFGLRTAPWDERQDPIKNARAAARYLRALHARFGTWPLALAGYNAGEGRVQGLMRRHGAGSFDELAAYLPAETRSYVPRVLALVESREGVGPRRLPGPAVRN
jgi:hypothetical protein